jgi:UPF0288 family protein (methanogenesis marker protein 3)
MAPDESPRKGIAPRQGRKRGRYDIVCLFEGTYVRWTSPPDVSLSPATIATQLRRCADEIDHVLTAAAARAPGGS